VRLCSKAGSSLSWVLSLDYIYIIPQKRYFVKGFCESFLKFFEVALVRSHFKPLCVLRTIYIAGGRSLCAVSVPHFQFTVLLRQPATSQPRPFKWLSVRLHSYSAKVRLLHPRSKVRSLTLHIYYTTNLAVCQGVF
jgi:hypothetical protein